MPSLAWPHLTPSHLTYWHLSYPCQTFTDCFNCLPVCAVVDEKVRREFGDRVIFSSPSRDPCLSVEIDIHPPFVSILLTHRCADLLHARRPVAGS